MFEEQFKEEQRARRRLVSARTVFESLRQDGSATVGDIQERFGCDLYGAREVLTELLDEDLVYTREDAQSGAVVYVACRGVTVAELEELRKASARERAEKAVARRLAREKAEIARREQIERENAEIARRKQIERENAEKARRERIEREKAERARLEQIAREKAEKAAKASAKPRPPRSRVLSILESAGAPLSTVEVALRLGDSEPRALAKLQRMSAAGYVVCASAPRGATLWRAK